MLQCNNKEIILPRPIKHTKQRAIIPSPVGIAQDELMLEADRPFLKAQVWGTAVLDCCHRGGPMSFTWVKRPHPGNNIMEVLQQRGTTEQIEEEGIFCGTMLFESVQLSDSALYQCMLNDSNVGGLSHGTYLQVYKPMEKTINLRETTKNKILIAEGFLLILCVLVPLATLLHKSKRLNELEKKKVKKEEENIYEGLNLDDCCSTYDQIERSQAHGPYQDVGNMMEQKEDIQLEKP